MANVTHWTERSTRDFLYSIAADFIEQLQERMEALPMKQSELAKAAKVSKGYVSKMFKNPGNLSLETIVKFARIVGMKVSIVGYVDVNDPNNSRGPIGADVFRKTWENAERPADMWAFSALRMEKPNVTLDAARLREHLAFQWDVYLRTSASGAPINQTGNRLTRQLPIEILDSQNTRSDLGEKSNA